MSVKEIIEQRRAYRSLEPISISGDLVAELGKMASLAPSCMNKQPWRFVFVDQPEMIQKLHPALASGNEWAKSASLIIAVFSKIDFDCQIKGRDYYLFDTGMATAFLILRATELGFVAHPIAGFAEDQVKQVLEIPVEMTVITLIIVGKQAATLNPVLSENMQKGEKDRPERLPLDRIIFHNRFSNEP